MPRLADPRVAARFAANLRRLRVAADLSQEELSFRAGVHRTQISLMESGDRVPRFDTLVRLIGALGVDHAALFDGIAWEPHEFTPHGYSLGRREDGDGAAEEA
ncbi:MAG: helix-turn-helix transcriptional regulator [Actinobacteria bacterium]|nr:helix-turn-helix transcriptional regulator [Actinomycetota bacterium]